MLSGNELLSVAEEDTKQKARHFRDLVFGLLDCSLAIFFFLPLFGQRTETLIRSVSLVSLVEISPWLRGTYFAVVIAIVAWGVLMLALQNCQYPFWTRNKSTVSLVLNAVGTVLFIVSLQPYAAAFLFVFLMIKTFLLIKKQ